MDSSILLPNSVFHNPILDIDDQNKTHTINKLIRDFTLTADTLFNIKRVFIDEMEAGLALAPDSKSSLLMQNTFVPEFPDGNESGYYLSLDLGTTNLRVILSKLVGGSQKGVDNEFTVKYYDIPNECRRGSSDNLFTFLAECIDDFVAESLPGYGKRLALGFTFSFPMTMTALNVGILETWTKNFDCPDAVRVDCARLLQEAIDRRPGPLPVDVVAILNDSTGSLVMGAYLDRDCAVAMILGTGHNACYIERADRIGKWADREGSVYADVREVAINIESGAFGDNGCLDFVRTPVDDQLDRESLFPRSFTFEKYISGHYIGDIVRRVLLLLTQKGVLFGGHPSDALKTMDSISSADLSIIEGDETKSMAYVQKLTQRLGYVMCTDEDVAIIRYVCSVVTVRATQLLAAVLAALIDRCDRPRVTVAIDGSLYKHHPKFHRLMTDFTRELLDTDKTFKLILAEDGSGKGAGLVAAIAQRFWAKHNNNYIDTKL